MENGAMIDNGEVSLEDFLLKEHEQSYKQLTHLDNMLSMYFWLYITLVVAVTAVDGLIVGLSGVGPNVLIFISISCLILFVIGLAILQLTLHTKDRQNLISAYIQEIIFYFMGKGLKPIGGNPRNAEAARILDFKHIFDESHQNDWHMRRRKHIQGYGSPDRAGDSWTSRYTLASKMTFYLVLILSGLIAFTVASFASGAIWGNMGTYEASQRSSHYLYFGTVLGMEFFVASWVFFRYTLKAGMKNKRESADEAFRKKREAWFAASPNPGKVEDLIESTISKAKNLVRSENKGEETTATEDSN